MFSFLPAVVFPPALCGPCKAAQPKTLLASKSSYYYLHSFTQTCISGLLRVEVQRPCGTLAKEQGSPELVSDYGAQRARF